MRGSARPLFVSIGVATACLAVAPAPGAGASEPADRAIPGVRLPGASGVEESVAEIMGRDRTRGVQARETPRSARAPHRGGTSFLAFSGPTGGESNFVPPDPAGAVSPGQILVAGNGRIKVFARNGVVGGLNTTLDDFFASVNGGALTYGPQIEYDRLSERWFVLAATSTPCSNSLLVAVSSGPRISSGASFTFFSFVGRAGYLTDGASLGVDANALYVGSTVYDLITVGCPAPEDTDTSAWVINKADLLAGTLTVTAFHDLLDSGTSSGEVNPQGVLNMDPSATEGYLVGDDRFVANRLILRRVSTPGGAPTLSAPIPLIVPPTSPPIDVPQPSGPLLEGNNDRLQDAMIARNRITGELSLWTAHQIQVDAAGVASVTGGRNGSRWYEIENLATTPSVRQSGTLFDSTAATPLSYWVASIAANGQGHASLNTSVAGAGVGGNAGIAASGRLRSDPLGTTSAPNRIQTSAFDYDTFDPGVEAWGFYSHTVVDPSDDMTFWTFQTYAHDTNRWGVRVIELRPPPPATPSSASSPVAAGQPSVPVTISGGPTGGAEFFDPGGGFPNRLGASVSGGVTVNSATFVDPTQLSLDLNTTGASAGTKVVTITNPDGQAAAAPVLTVTGGGGGAADTAAPDTTLGSVPKAKTRKRKATFTFSASEPATFSCKLDSGAFAPCTSPAKMRVKKGRHAFAVRATDAAGNTDPTPAAHRWKVKKKRRRR